MARGRLCSVHTRSSNDPGHAPCLPETLPNSPCPSGLSFPFCTTRFPFAFPLCPKNLLGSLILDSASAQRDARAWPAFWGLDWTYCFHTGGPSQDPLFLCFSQEAFPGTSDVRLRRDVRRAPPANARERGDGRAAAHRQTNRPTACQPRARLLCALCQSCRSQQRSLPVPGWAGDQPWESREGDVTGGPDIAGGGHSAC